VAFQNLSIPQYAKKQKGTSMNHNHDRSYEKSLSDEEIINIVKLKILKNINTYYGIENESEVFISGKKWGGQETARTFRFQIQMSQSSRKDYIIFVKLCPEYKTINPALIEFATLKKLYPIMSKKSSRFYVSRPLDFFQDINGYAMESVGTKCFKNYLLSNNSKFLNYKSISKLETIVSDCAKWLEQFHSITKSQHHKNFNIASVMTGISEDFDHKNFKDLKLKNEILDIIEQLSMLNGNVNLPCAGWHWDFTPGHVYLDNNRISIIDIGGFPDAPIYEDIGRFIGAMAAINNFPWYPFYDHSRANIHLCDIFISAYLEETNYQKEPFTLFCYIHKLKYLIYWFYGQRMRINEKVGPIVEKLYTDLRLSRLYNQLISEAIVQIQNSLSSYNAR
jgi:hypothetical protein